MKLRVKLKPNPSKGLWFSELGGKEFDVLDASFDLKKDPFSGAISFVTLKDIEELEILED